MEGLPTVQSPLRVEGGREMLVTPTLRRLCEVRVHPLQRQVHIRQTDQHRDYHRDSGGKRPQPLAETEGRLER